jgi:glycosyltransferase involved in cell wall biosynthesis
MKQNILLIENSGSDFYKSRLKYASFLKNEGYKVYILIPDDGYSHLIIKEGFIVFVYPLTRNKRIIYNIFKILYIIKKIYKSHEINIVHSFRFFPNIINVVINLFSKKMLILHVTGLGIVYSKNSPKYYLLKKISDIAYFFMILCSTKIVVQNPDDQNYLSFFNFMKNKIVLIKGSGVDTAYYDRENVDIKTVRANLKLQEDCTVFICVTRLLWEKGIYELVDAFKQAIELNNKIILLIVGSPDVNNPRHVNLEYIQSFKGSNSIIFLGNRNDIRELLSASDIFIYPSYYREGIPRGILEAASMSLPIITTDMPGCKLTVVSNSNGYLIPSRSTNAIINIIQHVLLNTNQLKSMGTKSRQIALNEFSNDVIYKEMMNLYKYVFK